MKWRNPGRSPQTSEGSSGWRPVCQGSCGSRPGGWGTALCLQHKYLLDLVHDFLFFALPGARASSPEPPGLQVGASPPHVLSARGLRMDWIFNRNPIAKNESGSWTPTKTWMGVGGQDPHHINRRVCGRRGTLWISYMFHLELKSGRLISYKNQISSA